MESFLNYKIRDFENESREVTFPCSKGVYVFPNLIVKNLEIHQLKFKYIRDGQCFGLVVMLW
jgi:hypothetical protein